MTPDTTSSSLVESGRQTAGAERRPGLLILTEDSKPARGGIAEYLDQLARVVAAECPVRIVSSIAGAGEWHVADADVRYFEVPWFRAQERMPGDDWLPLRKANTLRWLAARGRRVRRMLEQLLAEEPTGRVILGRLSAVTHPWAIACRELGVPYELFAYGLELVEPASPLSRWRQLALLRGAARVHAISRTTADLVRRLGVPDERIGMLLPGIDPAAYPIPDAAERRAVRADLGLGERRVVLSTGYLTHRKGFDLTIDAFAAVAAEFPDTALCIVGDGPERDALRRRAAATALSERIVFAGAVDDATKRALFAECELFVLANRLLPNDVEGFGIVFLEAGLYGKPTIGGDNGGVPDAVADGASGLLVDTDRDASPLAAALRALLGDPTLARRLGAQGRTRALRDYAWENTARDLLSSLRDVAAPLQPVASARLAARHAFAVTHAESVID